MKTKLIGNVFSSVYLMGNEINEVKWWGRIQAGQLVHDLRIVPQDGVEFEEAVQRVLQTVQLLIGQSCGGRKRGREGGVTIKSPLYNREHIQDCKGKDIWVVVLCTSSSGASATPNNVQLSRNKKKKKRKSNSSFFSLQAQFTWSCSFVSAEPEPFYPQLHILSGTPDGWFRFPP